MNTTPICPLCNSAAHVKPHREKDLFTCTKHNVLIDGDTRPGADGGTHRNDPSRRLESEEEYRERQRQRAEADKKKMFEPVAPAKRQANLFT